MMDSSESDVKIGIAITTLGQRPMSALLTSLSQSTRPPDLVAISYQGGEPLEFDSESRPFEVRVTQSSGGISNGRNSAISLLGPGVDLIGIPNDDSTYSSDALQTAHDLFVAHGRPAAIAGTLQENGSQRYDLPPDGQNIDRESVWRCIEPALFLGRTCWNAAGRFDATVGTGSPTPWQSGEGTDLLLRMLEYNAKVIAGRSIVIEGPGERRDLSPVAYREKVRGYSRGTGYVFARHGYSFKRRVRLVLAPVAKLLLYGPRDVASARLALARSIGRAEGLVSRHV